MDRDEIRRDKTLFEIKWQTKHLENLVKLAEKNASQWRTFAWHYPLFDCAKVILLALILWRVW